MLGPTGQEAVLQLHTSEIRVLHEMQTYITRRISADKQYSRTLLELATNALRFKPDIKTPMFDVRPTVPYHFLPYPPIPYLFYHSLPFATVHHRPPFTASTSSVGLYEQ